MTSRIQPSKKLKILCLHGYGTNKEFMKFQTQAFIKDFENIAEFIFVDGPIIVPLSFVTDPKVIKNLEAPPRSWLDFKLSHKTRADKEAFQSLDYCKKSFEEASDYYDGAMCFSQGSQAFQIILWYQARGLIDWEILKKIKFFINFSADAFRVSLKSMDWKRFEIPSLHFLSEEDFLFSKCVISPNLYKNPEIIYHTFGHRFPLLGLRQKRKMTSFLLRHGYGHKDNSGMQQSKL